MDRHDGLSPHLARIIDRQAEHLRRQRKSVGPLAVRVHAMYVPDSVWSGDCLDYVHAIGHPMSEGFAQLAHVERHMRRQP